MIKTRQEKQEFVQSFEKELKDIKNFCLAGYQGLTVKDLQDLRLKLKTVNATFRVIKNRLVSRVFKSLSLTSLDEHIKGPTAIILEKGDPVQTIKQLSTFSKANNKLKIRVGYFDNRFLSAEELSKIASLPPREQLIAIVIRGVSSPLIGFMNVLEGTIRNLVVVLKQIGDNKDRE